MTKLEAIAACKQFRKDADELLQRMKDHKKEIGTLGNIEEPFLDVGEVIANHVISIRALEDCITRQGLVLKNIGAPNPYPESYNPASSVVEPTADNLKL